MPLRKVFANAPLTARSSPFSKLSSNPTVLLAVGYGLASCYLSALTSRIGRWADLQVLPTDDAGCRDWRRVRSPWYSREVEFAATRARASGGIGRRAGFRCQCPYGRGGSSPPLRTADRGPSIA